MHKTCHAIFSVLLDHMMKAYLSLHAYVAETQELINHNDTNIFPISKTLSHFGQH